MKKFHILIFTAIALMIVACGSNPKDETKEDTPEATVTETISGKDESHATIMLTKEDFLVKIMNYEKNSEWVFEGDKPALIDFYADWCKPCRISSPILEELAVEYEGKIDIYKIDMDKERELAALFGIQSIPTFLFVPMEGRPTISSGIAQTTEGTKKMFRDQIDQILLQ